MSFLQLALLLLRLDSALIVSCAGISFVLQSQYTLCYPYRCMVLFCSEPKCNNLFVKHAVLVFFQVKEMNFRIIKI